MNSTREVNVEYTSNGEYWCIFLTRYHTNTNKSDELCRYWLGWYTYSCFADTNDVIYGDRIPTIPSTILCSLNYIQRSALLPLNIEQSVTLVGPLTFEPITISNCGR